VGRVWVGDETDMKEGEGREEKREREGGARRLCFIEHFRLVHVFVFHVFNVIAFTLPMRNVDIVANKCFVHLPPIAHLFRANAIQIVIGARQFHQIVLTINAFCI